MKVIYKPAKVSYVENGQRNPIRWACMQEIEPEVFVNTTNFFKCKDYFNDFLWYSKSGMEFSQYGMHSAAGKLDSNGGMWVLVSNTTPNFMANINACVNEEFGKTWGVSIVGFQVEVPNVSTPMLLYFSKECWNSTFRISLLTLCIRCCNISRKLKNFDELLDYTFMAEGHLNRYQMEVLKQRKYDLMLEKTHSWYASLSYNSQTQPRQKFEVIHNNGIETWFCSIPFSTLFPEIAETSYNSFSPLHNNLTDVEQEEEEEDEYEEECEQ